MIIKYDYVGINYYDPLMDADGTTANLLAGTEYCYRVSQTEAGGTPSEQSDPSCSQIYIPLSCENSIEADVDSINYINGLYGRDEWFYYVATLDGYLMVTSDIEGQLGPDTRLRIYGGSW